MFPETNRRVSVHTGTLVTQTVTVDLSRDVIEEDADRVLVILLLPNGREKQITLATHTFLPREVPERVTATPYR